MIESRLFQDFDVEAPASSYDASWRSLNRARILLETAKQKLNDHEESDADAAIDMAMEVLEDLDIYMGAHLRSQRQIAAQRGKEVIACVHQEDQPPASA